MYLRTGPRRSICIYGMYRSIELMSLPAFGRATLNRRWVISTRHHRSVQELHATKTNTEDESVERRQHASYSNKVSIDFEQTKEAYKSKDTLELLRSLVVFKLCSFDILVDKNKEVCSVFNPYILIHTKLTKNSWHPVLILYCIWKTSMFLSGITAVALSQMSDRNGILPRRSHVVSV